MDEECQTINKKIALAKSLGEKTKVYFKREEKNSSQQEAGWRALRPIQPLPFFSKRGLSSNATSIKSLPQSHSHLHLFHFNKGLSSNATSIIPFFLNLILISISISQFFDRRSLSFLFSGGRPQVLFSLFVSVKYFSSGQLQLTVGTLYFSTQDHFFTTKVY